MKKLFWVFSVIASVLLFASCSPDIKDTSGPQYGRLTVYAGGGEGTMAKTIKPSDTDLTITKYKLTATYSDNTTTYTKDFTGGTTTTEDLLVGTWTMKIDGYDEGDVIVASSGNQSVTINPGANSVSFTLSYIKTGEGTLTVDISIPDGMFAEEGTVILSAEGKENIVVPLVLSTEDGIQQFTCTYPNLAAGDYRVNIVITDESGKQIGFTLREVLKIHNGLTSSYVAALPKSFFPVGAPVFTTTSETETLLTTDSITMASPTEGATILYTKDGSDPVTNGTEYTGPITISQNTVLKAVAVMEGRANSEVITKQYLVAKAEVPLFSVKTGTYMVAQSVMISSSTEGSTIYYTIDGTEPTKNSQHLANNGVLEVATSQTIKAIAVKEGYVDSATASVTYTFKGTEGISVTNPTYDTLAIQTSWKGKVMDPSKGATLVATIGSAAEATYTWYLDGKDVAEANGAMLAISSSGTDGTVKIADGYHIIVVQVVENCELYSESIAFTADSSMEDGLDPSFSIDSYVNRYQTEIDVLKASAEYCETSSTTESWTTCGIGNVVKYLDLREDSHPEDDADKTTYESAVDVTFDNVVSLVELQSNAGQVVYNNTVGLDGYMKGYNIFVKGNGEPLVSGNEKHSFRCSFPEGELQGVDILWEESIKDDVYSKTFNGVTIDDDDTEDHWNDPSTMKEMKQFAVAKEGCEVLNLQTGEVFGDYVQKASCNWEFNGTLNGVLYKIEKANGHEYEETTTLAVEYTTNGATHHILIVKTVEKTLGENDSFKETLSYVIDNKRYGNTQ